MLLTLEAHSLKNKNDFSFNKKQSHYYPMSLPSALPDFYFLPTKFSWSNSDIAFALCISNCGLSYSHSQFKGIIQYSNKPLTFIFTLFSKRSAHWFHPVLPVTLAHWPWSASCFGVFCKLLSRPFDKIKMTRDRGRWPRDLGWFSCALYSETSVMH